MKKAVLNNWNLMRFLRLGLGIFILVQSVMAKDWSLAILGALFTIMPVFNIGCCGAGGCATRPSGKIAETTEDVTYEEVVEKKK